MKTIRGHLGPFSLSIAISLLGACASLQAGKKQIEYWYRPLKTPASYEEAGRWWGTKHANLKLTASQTDDDLIVNLIDKEKLGFFWIHSDLKDAFKKGYRMGYQDRTADLVLAPHLTEAAGKIGWTTAKKFVDTTKAFEEGWAAALRNAVDVFIVLISEGSQADRETFIEQFTQVYTEKYSATQALMKSGGLMATVSEGGTALYIDIRKTVAVLGIPTPTSLKTEVYHQTFRVMGDEWGRRLSNNLIKRDELIDLFRRSRTALLEVPVNLEANLCIVREAFAAGYGTDAENVFGALIKEAGYATAGLGCSQTPMLAPTPVLKKKDE